MSTRSTATRDEADPEHQPANDLDHFKAYSLFRSRPVS